MRCARAHDRPSRPRQQLVDAVDRVIGDALQDVAQIALRVDPVQLGRAQLRVHHHRRVAACAGKNARMRIKLIEELPMATSAELYQLSWVIERLLADP